MSAAYDYRRMALHMVSQGMSERTICRRLNMSPIDLAFVVAAANAEKPKAAPAPRPKLSNIIPFDLALRLCNPARPIQATSTEDEPTPAPSRIWLDDIIRVTADHFRVSPNDIVSARRKREIVLPRQIAMYLGVCLTPHPTTKIGRMIGGRDHTTIIHGERKITRLLDAGDEVVTAAVAAIRSRLGVPA